MKNNLPLNAFILCGGKSSRMGTEKGFVKFRNRTFTDWCLEAVKPITPYIKLVTGNKKYEGFGYPLVEDISKNKGPVGGIHTALENSDTAWNLILSCDIPGITTSALARLVKERRDQVGIAFLSDDKKDYPLIGIYHKNCNIVFSEAVRKNELRLMDIVEKLPHQRIQIPSGECGNINNINSPEELKELIENTLQI